MARLQDKVALVTGGALGLGEAIAKMLAREGAKVIVTDIKDAEGEAVADAIARQAAPPSTGITMLPTKARGARRLRPRSSASAGSMCS